jgi:hypothetical protein
LMAKKSTLLGMRRLYDGQAGLVLR